MCEWDGLEIFQMPVFCSAEYWLLMQIVHPTSRTWDMSTSPKVIVQYYASSAVCLVVFGALRLLRSTPGTASLMTGLIRRVIATDLPKESYWDTLFSWKMYKSVTASILLDLTKTARSGASAPNTKVFSVDGQKQQHLLDFAKEDRPLVVNFGSITCPVFMAKLSEFERLNTEFGSVADFLVVYIEEAHPSDGWMLKVGTWRTILVFAWYSYV